MNRRRFLRMLLAVPGVAFIPGIAKAKTWAGLDLQEEWTRVRGYVKHGGLRGGGIVTLGDWAKRLDPENKVPDIVELISDTNNILADMHWDEIQADRAWFDECHPLPAVFRNQPRKGGQDARRT